MPGGDPSETFLDRGDLRLFTREVGDGPRVFVLHGGPGAQHDYLLPDFDELARERKLFYYDQRGGGRSVVPRSMEVSWRDHVEDLRWLIEITGSSPATLLGYSWGGLLALLFATQHANMIGRLALVSPAPATAEARAEFERRFAARSRDPRIVAARRDLQRSGLRATDPDRYSQRLFELSVAGYFADPDRAHDLSRFTLTGRVQRSVWESLGEYDIRDELSRVNTPALVVHGAHDPIPLESARETASLLRARLEVLPDSGHVPYLEEKEAFLSLLNEFLPAAARTSDTANRH
jgi:proline iminopeptidase